MQKVEADKQINLERKKEPKMRRRALAAAIISLLAVEPLLGACANLSNIRPANPITSSERKCQIPQPSENLEDEAAVSEMRMQHIIAELRKSTVKIDSEESIGSGVILYRCNGETAILTNRHVVESDKVPGAIALSQNLQIMNEGKAVRPIRVVFAPHELDLALVFVREDIGPPVKMASKIPRVGARVLIVGNPLGVEDSVSRGIVSNFITNTNGFPYRAIQTDAAINAGNSGGGIFLSNGELLGIVSFKLRLGVGYAEGMGYAMPLGIVREFPLEAWKEIAMAAPVPAVPKG